MFSDTPTPRMTAAACDSAVIGPPGRQDVM
jgi:hypothetical protein